MKKNTPSSCRGVIHLPLGSKQSFSTPSPQAFGSSTGCGLLSIALTGPPGSLNTSPGSMSLAGLPLRAVELSLLQIPITQPMSPPYMSSTQARLQCLRGEQHETERRSCVFWLPGQFISKHEEEARVPHKHRIKSKKGKSPPKSVSCISAQERNTAAVTSTSLLINVT